jgi:hypothetical protein
MNNKICNCSEPVITQAIPSGYKGQVVCARCGGVFDYPRKQVEYKGEDQVAKYLFDISKNSNGLTFETAVLKMLLRIEEAIYCLGEVKPVVKGKN